ncbi:hypothetical protein [Hymenobacter volaticus]|uniref:PAP2 family protein n=1 Tax=Hymenobacter volaticus TaxID=2932254 RepID=A0ABY4G559_9BACT|nr:hypothetical protein [Hymenobacter volaticus]UOQ66023.1 hypothetical protein MUN86_21325 [Hymenobacter volaticus]
MNRSIALLFSVVCHPLLLPSYLFYVVCYELPGVVRYPLPANRWQLTCLVALFTFVLPSVGTALLLWRGLITGSMELPERRQRPLPFLLATLSFGAATLLLNSMPEAVDALLRYMLLGMTLAVLLTLLVSLRWKISAHGVGVGGAVGLMMVLYVRDTSTGFPIGWLLASILLAGVVLSARLALNAHTPAQAWAGFSLGISLVLGLGVGSALT